MTSPRLPCVRATTPTRIASSQFVMRLPAAGLISDIETHPAIVAFRGARQQRAQRRRGATLPADDAAQIRGRDLQLVDRAAAPLRFAHADRVWMIGQRF